MNSKVIPIAVISIAVVLVLSVVLLGSSNSDVTGYVAATDTYLSFPVNAWGDPGWHTCSNQEGSWIALDNFCKAKGFPGVSPDYGQGCHYKYYSNRYHWNGALSGKIMVRGSSTGAGTALDRINCITSPPCADSDGGDNPLVKGIGTNADACWTTNTGVTTLREYYCGAPSPGYKTYSCAATFGAGSVCKDGACVPSATCTDNVRNQGETGVDCGGPCSACAGTQPATATYYCCGGSKTDHTITTNGNAGCGVINYYTPQSWNNNMCYDLRTCNSWCTSKGYVSGAVGSNTKQCICSSASIPTYYCCGGSKTDFRITTTSNCDGISYYRQKSWSPYCFTSAYTCNNWCVLSKGYNKGILDDYGGNPLKCVCY